MNARERFSLWPAALTLVQVLVLALALTCDLGCEARAPAEHGREELAALPAVERPSIEFAGCRDLPSESVCVLAAERSTRLQIWIDVQAQAALRVRVDGRLAEFERAAVDGGLRLTLELSAEAKQVRVEGSEPPWREPFDLAVERETVPAVVAAAKARVKSGDPAQRGEAIVELEAALAELRDEEQLAALQFLRRLHHGSPEGLAYTEQAAELADSLGRGRDLADAAVAAAYVHLYSRGDLVAARRWVSRLETVEGPEARAWANYYGGLLAHRTGDLGEAIRAFERARIAAERVGMIRDVLGASEMHAALLAELGRGEEALVSARETLALGRAPGLGCSDRARLLGNVAWTYLVLARAGHAHDRPRPLLLEQLGLVDEGGACPDTTEAFFARVNLAYVALEEGEPEEAGRWLAGLPDLLPLPLQAWAEEARARVGLETGRDELLPPFGRRSPSAFEIGLRWTTALREAETLERFGFVDAATTSYMEAEGLLDEASSTLGVDVGRELFFGGRSASVRGLVDLLIRGGRVDEALCRVRLARGRELRAVDQAARIAGLSDAARRSRRVALERALTLRERAAAASREDWQFSAPQRAHREQRRDDQLAEAEALLDEALRLVGGSGTPTRCEELPSPVVGEVTLAPFEADGGVWLFLADDGGVVVERGEGDALAQLMASPRLRPRIEGARRLRVLAGGETWSQSLHALPFGEGVLLDVAPLVYSLDLPARSRDEGGEALAVVVANPSRDLPEAEAEAEAVAKALSERGWAVRTLVGDQATRARLSAELGQARLFHYAGHGTHRGRSGWDAALLLHDGDTLSVADVLALPRVPDLIVLSGCETATLSADTLAGGMNLGRAFVLAGAGWVIAAEGEVDDALAREVGESLHAELELGAGRIDGAATLRRVQLELRAREPSLGWGRFRVVVP